MIARWAAPIGLLLLMALAVPIHHEISSRKAFADGHLVRHVVKVVTVRWDSGNGYDHEWVSQDVRVEMVDGTMLRKPDVEKIVDVEEGELVTVGLWHGRLVTMEGQYVRSSPAAVVFFLPIAVGALMMAALSAVRARYAGLYARVPYVAGYVTQSVVLCFVVCLATGAMVAWWPLIGLLAAAGPPVLLCWWRYGRRSGAGRHPFHGFTDSAVS
jgi:hypothetical protein